MAPLSLSSTSLVARNTSGAAAWRAFVLGVILCGALLQVVLWKAHVADIASSGLRNGGTSQASTPSTSSTLSSSFQSSGLNSDSTTTIAAQQNSNEPLSINNNHDPSSTTTTDTAMDIKVKRINQSPQEAAIALQQLNQSKFQLKALLTQSRAERDWWRRVYSDGGHGLEVSMQQVKSWTERVDALEDWLSDTVWEYTVQDRGMASNSKLESQFAVEQDLQPRKEFVIGYCAKSADPAVVLPTEEDMSVLTRLFARHVFPERRTTIKPVYITMESLPSGIKPESRTGLEMLGLIGTHIRVCKIGGGTALAKFLLTLHSDIKFLPVQGRRVGDVVIGDDKSQEWSKDRRVHAPPKVVLISASEGAKKNEGKPFLPHPLGPFLTRHAFESWYDGTHSGIPAQFETKRDSLPGRSLAWFLPNVVMHMGSVHGEDFSRVLKRGKTWNAREARLSKSYLITMLNSNCGDAVVSLDIFFKLWGRYTFVRELLTYAFYEITGKPVHNLGRCPLGNEGAERAGISPQKREKLQGELVQGLRKGINRHYVTNRKVYAAHKFSIVFENSPVESYATEKVVNAWMAGSIPVYWGGEKETYADVFNLDAIIYCHFPAEITVMAMNKTLADSVGIPRMREIMYKGLMPHFKVCIQEIMRLDADHEAYERMLSQSIAPFKDGKPSGVWDMARLGEMVREAYVGLGYDSDEARLENFFKDRGVKLS